MTGEVGRAVAALRAGGLVGVPTETVYGLAALVDDEPAVRRIFDVKGRPTGHPLIVHVASPAQIDAYACDVPPYARALVDASWPGPITIVVPRRATVAETAAGGLPTIGLRAPAHPTCHDLLTALGRGVAAPSANRFGRVSPTTAQDVLAELGPFLDAQRDLILDGGPCPIGLESTIVDCTGAQPALLRLGAVTGAEVARLSGSPLATRPSSVPAPGTLPAHYAPSAEVVLVEHAGHLSAPANAGGGPTGLIALASVRTAAEMVRLAAPADAAEYARILYAALRAADAKGLPRVVVVLPPADGIGAAIRDRLTRAAAANSGRGA